LCAYGEKFAGEFLPIEALNINLSGPALPLAFSATPDDQLLGIIFVFARDRRTAKPLERLRPL
jgi:hypothetical protein